MLRRPRRLRGPRVDLACCRPADAPRAAGGRDRHRRRACARLPRPGGARPDRSHLPDRGARARHRRPGDRGDRTPRQAALARTLGRARRAAGQDPPWGRRRLDPLRRGRRLDAADDPTGGAVGGRARRSRRLLARPKADPRPSRRPRAADRALSDRRRLEHPGRGARTGAAAGDPDLRLALASGAGRPATRRGAARDRRGLGDRAATGGTRAQPAAYRLPLLGAPQHRRDQLRLGSLLRSARLAPAGHSAVPGSQRRRPLLEGSGWTRSTSRSAA